VKIAIELWRKPFHKWNLLRAVPATRGGEILKWLGTFTDLEEQKRAAQLLGQRQKLESIGLLAGRQWLRHG